MKENYTESRKRMVEIQLKGRGIKDEKVLEAMGNIPRHMFIPKDFRSHAYRDEPVPIGNGQTISQPYIVAYMTEKLSLKGNEKALEIGTGSGYQAAVLADIVQEVYTVECVKELSISAQKILRELGYENIHFKVGDGSLGWNEYAPYDVIIVTAAPSKTPEVLTKQLNRKGRMVIPVGSVFQELILFKYENNRLVKKKLLPVRFVPLIQSH